MAKELGGVLWYVAAVCTDLNLNMGDVARENAATRAPRVDPSPEDSEQTACEMLRKRMGVIDPPVELGSRKTLPGGLTCAIIHP